MALSGSVTTGKWTGETYWGSMTFAWSATQNANNNTSTISWRIYANVGRNSGTGSGWIYYNERIVKINGVSVYYNKGPGYPNEGGTQVQCYNGTQIASGSKTLTHNADGTCSFSVEIGVGISSWAINRTGSDTFTLNQHQIYSLSTSAGTGSAITVNRTSSGYASTGNLSSGARLYTGDTLKITFTPSANYAIATHTVNGSTFTSGGTHTVAGNVNVVATAQVLASKVGATNASIESVSTITVTKYNNSYYHSLQYSFGSLSGYIKADGTTSSSEVKISQTSVSFQVPSSFYAQIPNSKTGTCTITCRTYSSASSTTVLGNATTCTFIATASLDLSRPSVDGTVVDTNANTITLTGDSSTLIRYKSTAQCTITATARASSTIVNKYINSVAPSNNIRTFTNVSTNSFVFQATDSRGYVTAKTVNPIVIAYINLTINPIISRVTPTGSNVVMTFSGDYYRGSFGSYFNTLTIQYRYRLSSSSSWTSWETVSPSNYTIGSSSFSTNSAISIGDTFDYRESYVFQVKAYDGANGTTLTSITKTIILQRGIPVFDWGENDFTFHVPIKIGSTTLTEAQLQQLLALLA